MSGFEPEGRRCLSVTIESNWAHFRRVDTTTGKQTYRIIPRTTVAGLLAAIVGAPRDSYYDVFSQAASAIAIVPKRPLDTMAIPMSTVPTSKDDIKTAAGVSGKTIVAPEVLGEERKRRSFEYLRDPSYRIHVTLQDQAWMDELIERLDANSSERRATNRRPAIRSVYTPALGKTECLASIPEATVGKISPAERRSSVDSTIPEGKLKPTTDVRYTLERSPAFMTAAADGRSTTGYVSYLYSTTGKTLDVADVSAHRVNGDTVCFL